MISGITRYTLGAKNAVAVDDVYYKAKELYVDTLPPPSSGIVINTVEQIWNDMTDPNEAWVSNMPSSYGQFLGPVKKTIYSDNFDDINMWFEVEAQGDGSGCSFDINTSINTMVEIGHLRLSLLIDGKWELRENIKNTQTPVDLGGNHPHYNNVYGRPCGLDEANLDPQYPNLALMDTEYGMFTNSDGFLQYRPDFYYRNHAWTGNGLDSTVASNVMGVVGSCYMRLVLKDPNGIDDRHLAKFTTHLGSDIRLDGVYIGDVGISRYKYISNDWESVNLFSFDPSVNPENFAKFQALNPPVYTTP